MILQVGVKLLVQDSEGRYLFLKRAKSYKSGTQPWDIPGGRINPDEPILEALAREVYEETGMRMAPNPALLAAQDIFVPEKDLHVVRLTYAGSAVGEITISDEHAEYRWMTKQQAFDQHIDSYLEKIKDKL